jgi:hypothetical protein
MVVVAAALSRVGWSASGVWQELPFPKEWLASGQAAGEPAQQLFGVQAEALEQAGVLVGVDLVGEFLVGLVSLVVLALLVEHLDDLCLVDLHTGLL